MRRAFGFRRTVEFWQQTSSGATNDTVWFDDRWVDRGGTVRKLLDPARWPPVVTMTIALWVAVFVIFTLRSFLVPLNFWNQFPPRVITCVVGALMCLGLAAASRPIRGFRLGTQLAIGIVAGVISAIIYAAIVDFVFACMAPSPEDAAPYFMKIFNRAQFNIFVFMSWSFAFLAVNYAVQSQRQALELAEAQALAVEAHNRMLRYQINPHFLFNALNALQALLLERRVAQARGVVERLAEFLRYSLARKPEDNVTLREEAEAQEAYLCIEQVRFSDRLTFHREIDPAVEDVRVPSMLLQPLIENAVKYAVGPASGPVGIWLRAWPADGDLVLEVRDDGESAPKKPGLGVGLDNVSRRLKLAYGDRATFEHGPVEPRGYVARLTLPLETP